MLRVKNNTIPEAFVNKFDRVWIHSETRTWHDKNIQSNAPYSKYSQQSSINLSVWLNGWIFVLELSGCGFESGCDHSDYFGYRFIKNNIMFMYLLCIYKTPIILSLFKIDTLKFAMYILMNFTCPLKTYVVRS